MFFGFSRDDTFEIIQMYKELKIYKDDPFEIIDAQYMGEFIIQGIKKARAVNPKLKIGVCGEHGGNPESIKFFKKAGFNYVSCSPFKVPIALLASNKLNFEE